MFCPLVDALEDWLETPATHHLTPYSALRDNKEKFKKDTNMCCWRQVNASKSYSGLTCHPCQKWHWRRLRKLLHKKYPCLLHTKSWEDLLCKPLFWTAFDPENCIHGILSQGLAEAWPCEWAEWPRIWSPRAKDLSSPPPKLSIGIEPMSKTTKQSFQKTLSWHRKKDIQINTKVYLETKIHKLI